MHYTQETAILRREILQIVEEETMYVDGIIRERLLLRLQSAFSSNAQNSGPSQSPIWPSHALDVSGGDGTYIPSTAPPMSNPPPWSEWETRHSNHEDISRIENMEHHSLVRDNEANFIGPNLESEFFLSDMPNFDYGFGAGDGINGNGFDVTK